MKYRDLFRMAKENLLRRKLRTCLTVISIVIGTTSIIMMIALGLGMQTYILKEFDSYGSVNVLYVSPKEEVTKTSRFYETKLVSGLTDEDLQVMERVRGVEFTAPLCTAAISIATSKYYSNITLVGLDPFFMGRLGFLTEDGRLPKENEYEMIFGEKVLESFQKLPSANPNAAIQRPDSKEEEEEETGIVFSFGEEEKAGYLFDPLAERYKLEFLLPTETVEGQMNQKLFSLNAVGVLKGGDLMKDNNIYVPIDLFQKLQKSAYEGQGSRYKTAYSQIMVRVKELNQVEHVKKEIESKGYSVFSLSSILDSVTKTINLVKLALGAIGGIALLVAAIGITNTMVMAITERKKEIGIMKVIGATVYDIKRLFLLEAAIIGLMGGIAGLSICVVTTGLVNSNYFAKAAGQGGRGFLLSIPPFLVLGGLVFTTLIGIASGYLPALKAMRCSALEAIRNE